MNQLKKQFIYSTKSNFIIKYTKVFYLEIYLIILSLGIIFSYINAFYTTNYDIVVYAHDNLDSNIAMYKLLSDTNTFFSSNTTIIPNIMNGIPRVILTSEYNIVSMLYYLFNSAEAYLINEVLIRLIAFTGMFLLLKKYIFSHISGNNINQSIIIIGTALIFSLLPYWSNAGVSIAGQPFVLYAFLNIKNKDLSFKNWLILGLFPFYSSLVLAGIFVLTMLTIISIHDWIKKRTINYYLFLTLSMMSILYLLVEYRLVTNMLDPLFIPHRMEFVPKYLDYPTSLIKSTNLFFKSQYHAHSIHGYFLIPFIFVAAIISLFNKRISQLFILSICVFLIFNMFYVDDIIVTTHWVNYINVHLFKSPYKTYFVLVTSLIAGLFLYKKEYLAFYLLVGILLISLFSGFEDYIGFQVLKESFPLLKQVQFDRFYFLFALLWFILFAVSSKILLKKTKFAIILILFILLKQSTLSFELHNSEKWRKPIGMEYYYSKNVYSAVKDYIPQPVSKYKVMSIGLSPAIAIYNGFYTLDAYWATYPLEYKHEFRKIIAPQLAKSLQWTKYFDAWGSRCRLMDTSKNISLNLEQFKKMGGKYILSSYNVNINNGENVDLLNEFSAENSLYDIYLYKVK